MTTSDRAGQAPGGDPLPEDAGPVGAQGGFPPPPPLADPGDQPAGGEVPDTAGTNTMAVLGLVFAFLLPVLGVLFSAVGLVQTRRRGQAGRRLAAAGLVVSLVLLAVVAVLLATVGASVRRTVGAPQAGVPAASAPVPAGNPADEAVAAACSTVMPAMAQLHTDLAGTVTLDEVAARVGALQDRISAAAGSSRDAGFTASAQDLAADFGRLVDTARAGGDPGAVVGSIEQDGTALGRRCGTAGWLP
jgi:hypothetical protein